MGMFSKLKQYKDMRSQAKKMQSDLEEETAVGRGAGGDVIVEMNGNYEIVDIDIDTALLREDRKEKLEKALKDAHADAGKQLKKVLARRMKEEDIDLSALSKKKEE
jgi:DNA-binding YbaB/EbfC family protein